MDTPICDFVTQYANSNPLRLHMPGHKGLSRTGMESLDITEVDGADVLYSAKGIIKDSEKNASALFGSAKTLYSTEGSSLGIRAMLYLATVYGRSLRRSPRILAGRNAHKTFMTASALLDLDVVWLFPRSGSSILSCPISAMDLEIALLQMDELPLAVYLTNPDYLGNMVNLRPLAEVCHKYGVLLLVDNAHGAYLHFLPQPCHPMDLGADLCCDSAHKTLPVLTGGAYLHISKTAPEFLCEQAEFAMSLFASTSPSYLLLQSLDEANRYLWDGYKNKLSVFGEKILNLKTALQSKGFALAGSEVLKLTLAPKSFGYTGESLASILREQNIECEFADPDYLVMMLTPEIPPEDLERLESILLSIERKRPILQQPPPITQAIKKLSVREAILSLSEEEAIRFCRGKILASAGITCPPAIPVLICGEEITEEAIACMEYYGITHCRVVKEQL